MRRKIRRRQIAIDIVQILIAMADRAVNQVTTRQCVRTRNRPAHSARHRNFAAPADCLGAPRFPPASDAPSSATTPPTIAILTSHNVRREPRRCHCRSTYSSAMTTNSIGSSRCVSNSIGAITRNKHAAQRATERNQQIKTREVCRRRTAQHHFAMTRHANDEQARQIQRDHELNRPVGDALCVQIRHAANRQRHQREEPGRVVKLAAAERHDERQQVQRQRQHP